MKTYKIGMLTLAAAALTACSTDVELGRNTDRDVITYSVNTANQTRAMHSFCANQMPTSFKVWANYKASAESNNTLYIDGDEVVQVNENKYASTVNRYWPEDGGTMDFYAFVDAEKIDDNAGSYFKFNEGSPKFENFTVNQDIEKQKDLLYAVKKGVSKSDEVALNFRHALSQICYKVKNANPNLEITVNSIKINNLTGSATYNFPDVSTDGNYNAHGPESSNPDLSYNGWDCSGAVYNQSYEVSPIGSDGNAITIGAEEKNLTCPDDNHSDFKNVLNLIPQNRPAASSESDNDGTSFSLNISITNVVKVSGNADEKTFVDTKTFEVPAAIDWKEGYRYIYTFNFAEDWTPDGLIPITFTVSTDDFVPNYDELPHQKVLMRYGDPENGVKPLYFATANIGANRPEDGGLFFWWGDVKGHKVENGIISDGFNFKNDNLAIFTANKTQQNLIGDGIISEDGEINIKFDAARVQWGSAWRLPTREEFQWLIDNCEIVWNDGNSGSYASKGFEFTSNTTGGKIFFPTPGYCNSSGFNKFGVASADLAYYWCSTIDLTGVNMKHGYHLWLKHTSNATTINIQTLSLELGQSIRPVTNED